MKKLTTEEFIEKAKRVHGDKYSYEKTQYINSRTKVCIICPEHGEFWQLANAHLQGQGCSVCGRLNQSQKLSVRQNNRRLHKGRKCFTTKEFIQRANEVHRYKYKYDKCRYTKSKYKVTITCEQHGDFKQTAGAHLRGCGCPKCKLVAQTRLYNRLKESFPNLEILFEVTNKIIPWIGKQRADIYIPAINMIIEYNGEQHYIPVSKFGGKTAYHKQIQMDQLKRQKCINNNCILIEMRYNYNNNDYQNLIQVINSLLYENTIKRNT